MTEDHFWNIDLSLRVDFDWNTLSIVVDGYCPFFGIDVNLKSIHIGVIDLAILYEDMKWKRISYILTLLSAAFTRISSIIL